MNILLLGRYNETETLSGPEKFAKRLFHELYLTQNKITFMEYYFDGDKYGLYKKLFGKEQITIFENSPVFRLGILRMFLDIIKIKPNLIHFVTFERFSIVLWPLIFILKIKTVYTVHGIIVYENKFLKSRISKILIIKDYITEKMLSRYSSFVCFLSTPSKILMNKYFHIDTQKEKYVKNGADKIFADIKRTLSSEKLKVVFAGGLDRPEKGGEFLLETMKEITIDFELFIITDLDKLSKGKEIQDKRIRVLEYMSTSDLAQFYTDKDIFLSLGYFETFSINVIESMSAGLIPIVTEETGVSSAINNGVNGIVIKYGDSEALKSALETININRSDLNKMSQKARDIYNIFNWTIVAEEYMNIYKSVYSGEGVIH